MNKLLFVVPILLACFYHNFTHAADNNNTTVTRVHHVIINNIAEYGDWVGINYQLITPSGDVYKNFLYAGTSTSVDLDIHSSPNLSGTYVLQFISCPPWRWTWTCRSYSGTILVQNNADIVWELSRDKGVTVTMTNQ